MEIGNEHKDSGQDLNLLTCFDDECKQKEKNSRKKLSAPWGVPLLSGPIKLSEFVSSCVSIHCIS